MPDLHGLVVDTVSLVDRAAVRDPVQQSEPMRFLVWKRDNQTPQGGSMTDEEKAALKKAQDDAAAAVTAIATANATIETLKAENAELKKAAEPVVKADEPKVDLSKADPAMRAYVEKMEADRKTERAADQARIEKAEKDAAEADKVAKAERDARVTREFVTKAEGYKALPIEAAKFGPVLKEASEKLSKDAYDELDRVLKAADAASADLFKEHGRAREGASADSAYAELEKAAAELRKADPKLTVGDSQTRVLKADRALAQRVHDED